jgi:hypothetical protein
MPSMSTGAMSWFHNVSTYGGEIFNIEHFVIADSKFKIQNYRDLCMLLDIGNS